ncbi:hypothetical protein RRF57_012750 [Xylaria bambusicola]|uniref:Uncharacterized protein n=1 Tax=Xylaria bambusicola TaxID=326684 RepID=A0AAN7UZX8_9PEZI
MLIGSPSVCSRASLVARAFSPSSLISSSPKRTQMAPPPLLHDPIGSLFARGNPALEQLARAHRYGVEEFLDVVCRGT